MPDEIVQVSDDRPSKVILPPELPQTADVRIYGSALRDNPGGGRRAIPLATYLFPSRDLSDYWIARIIFVMSLETERSPILRGISDTDSTTNSVPRHLKYQYSTEWLIPVFCGYSVEN